MTRLLRRGLALLALALLFAPEPTSQLDTPPGAFKPSGSPGKNVNFPR